MRRSGDQRVEKYNAKRAGDFKRDPAWKGLRSQTFQTLLGLVLTNCIFKFLGLREWKAYREGEEEGGEGGSRARRRWQNDCLWHFLAYIIII